MAEKPTPAAADKAETPLKKPNPRLQAVIKNHFWIVSGLIVVTALGVWYFGVDALDKQFAQGKQAIDNAYLTLGGMESTVNKKTPNAAPNASFAVAVDDERKVLTSKVLDAWWELYDRQVSKLVGPLPAATEMQRSSRAWVKRIEIGAENKRIIKLFPYGQEVTYKLAANAMVLDANRKEMPKPAELLFRVAGSAIFRTAVEGNQTVISWIEVYNPEDVLSSTDWESDSVEGTRAKIKAVERKPGGMITLRTAGPEISFPLTDAVKVPGTRGVDRFESLKPADDIIYLTTADNALEEIYEQVSLFSVNRRVPMFQDLVLMSPAERPDVGGATDTYANNLVLEEDFEALFSLLNLRHESNKNVFGEIIPNVASGGDPIGVLVWNPISGPAELRQRYRTTAAASKADLICVTYEDIWVFRSLFTVIQRINSSPIDVWLARLRGENPAEAKVVDQGFLPIKRIDFCDIGQHAVRASFTNPGNIAGLADGGLGAAGQGVDDLGDTNTNAGGGAIDPGMPGELSTGNVLLDDRYLDGRNQSVDPNKPPPYTEYRQMAVQLTVLMDQRLIPVLISECANAPLLIEVRQVRASLADVDVPKAAGGAKDPNKVDEVEKLSNDVKVMIRGIVNIYTPPKEDKLGQGEDQDPANRDYGIPNKPQ